jgi:hypothetical protein
MDAKKVSRLKRQSLKPLRQNLNQNPQQVQPLKKRKALQARLPLGHLVDNFLQA